MRVKKIAAGALAAMLLLGTVLTPARAESDTLPAVPQVTVLGTRVTGGETFELSLQVRAAQFQTVGAVLTYDTTKLEPIAWDGDAHKPIPVTGTDWTASTALHTKSADHLSGKPALAYLIPGEGGLPSGRACLYLGADTLQPTAMKDVLAVTVRFKYVGETKPDDVKMPTAAPADESGEPAGPFTVEFATGNALNGSIPGAQLYFTADADNAYALEPVGATSMKTPTVAFLLTDGSSIDSGAHSGGGGFAITFFDWDGSVIDAISAPQDATDAVKTLTDTLKADAASALNAKAGYAFDQWLVVEQTENGLAARNGTFTSNDTALSQENQDLLAPADLSKLTSGTSVLVQAAYRAKTTAGGDTEDLVNGGNTGNLDKYYTISEPVYSRYGSADADNGSYSLKLTAYRNSQTDGLGYGVTRLREPAIIVTMTSAADGKNIQSLIRLDNTDVTEFEVVPTKRISAVSYKVVDVYGVSNWPGSADKSNPNVSKDSNTFIREGTRGFLSEQAAMVKAGGNWDATVTNQAFADAYLGVNATRANPAWWSDARCENAKKMLTEATPADGARLTSAEVQAALNKVS